MTRHKQERPGGLFDRMGQLLTVTTILLALGWIGLVGSVHLHEMIVGAVVVVLCAVFCRLVFRSETLSFDLRLQDVLQCRYIPWSILSGSLEMTILLLKDLWGTPPASYYRVCGFRGGMRDPVAVGRSALATAYTTIGPSFIVIGIDPHQNHMLFHQMQRSDVPRMTQALGAQA